MSTAVRTAKFKMPSIYRPKDENVLRCKIGYSLDRNGNRRRKEFRLGVDPVAAHQKALSLSAKWLKIEQRHWSSQSQFLEMFPEEPKRQPVWTDILEREAEPLELYHATPPEDLPGDEMLLSFTPAMSLRQASTEMLERISGKVARDAKSPGTYLWYEQHLRLGLVSPAIDPDLSVTAIRVAHVEQFCAYWTDIKARASERKEFGWRSARHRLNAFDRLLRDLKGRVDGFVYPDAAERVIKEAKETVAGS
ncbi:MAG: hypothetical protein H7144_01700 [Burkholderiales bacterium]|nr:hypothetical protein [Phycisphaerae bacterium]